MPVNDLPHQPIRPVGSGLASSPEALEMAALGRTVPPPAPPAPQMPGHVPAPARNPAQAAPLATAPSAPASAGENYQTRGRIDVEFAVNGDVNRFAHIEHRIGETTATVQKRLADTGLADQILKARTDPALRAQLTAEIDRIALETIVAGAWARNDETPYVIAVVVNEILGLGPLEPLWADPDITEVIVNGPSEVFVERGGKLVRATGVRFRSREHLLDVCGKILSPLNRQLDQKNPLADGRLPDGSRVNAVHHAVAPRGPLLTVRRFPQANRSLADLVELGAMNREMAQLLAWLVKNRATSLVVGSTGAGKSLDIDTPIPTPNGFTRMGDLRVGDTVFDEHGQPTAVVGAYDIQHDRSCYEIVFSDGSKIIADAEHLWLTETRSARAATGRTRKHEGSRARRHILQSSEVRVLETIGAALPADTAVSTQDLSRILGWTADQQTRWYPAVRDLAPIGRGLRGERLYLASDLTRAALRRWNRPWHDQRHMSERSQVRTTEQILATMRTSTGHANHSVALVGAPVSYPTRDLPLSPRVLGLWLGDGATAQARFSTADPELLEDFRAEGWEVRHIADYDYSITGGLRTLLRELGVLGDKHIPDTYLLSSEAQRRALLSGLLDTDGGVTRGGGVEFYSSKEKLARQVLTLVASLGYRPTLRSKPSTLNGRVTGTAWTVAFQGRGDEFRLLRKLQLQAVRRNHVARQGDRARTRYIVDIRPVESRPVRCIRVANDSHLFLAGETYIPTHNTTLLNALSAAIPRNERVITIEDSLELRLNPTSHVAAMEARPADAAGANEVSIRSLVKNALRQRPDRIIVGEVRDQAALDMLQACNTGHEGSMSTVHANGPNEVIQRLSVMVAQGGEIPADKVDWLVGSALDIIIMIRRYKDGSRRVSGVYEVPDVMVLDPGAPLRTIPLWEWKRTGESEDGTLLGEYVEVNPISQRMRDKLGLDYEPELTWSEVVELSTR
jgi:Flp pilus assembly CpaF family ATPase